MKWHACLASLAAGMALTPVAHAQFGDRTPYPPDTPGMTGNLDFDTALPAGVTPLMSLDEIGHALSALGYTGYASLSSVNFSIPTGLPDEVSLPEGGVYARNSLHRVNAWYDLRDEQSINRIDAQLFLDLDCLDRLVAAFGEPGHCGREPEASQFACQWTDQGAGYSVSAQMRYRSYLCEISLTRTR